MGRLDWHAQECDRLVRDNSVLREVDPDQVWRIKGSARLEPRALAVLRELWHWRREGGAPPEPALRFLFSHRTP